MSELADATRSSRSRLSHAVSRLEERGWVERPDCETDRRGQLAGLTDTGLRRARAAAPGHVDGVREHVIDRLSHDQITQLADIADVIAAGLTPIATDLGPTGAQRPGSPFHRTLLTIGSMNIATIVATPVGCGSGPPGSKSR